MSEEIVEKVICKKCEKVIDDNCYRICAICGVTYCFDCLVELRDSEKFKIDKTSRNVSGTICTDCWKNGKKYKEQIEAVNRIKDDLVKEWQEGARKK